VQAHQCLAQVKSYRDIARGGTVRDENETVTIQDGGGQRGPAVVDVPDRAEGKPAASRVVGQLHLRRPAS
jgi:hypothetical protein